MDYLNDEKEINPFAPTPGIEWADDAIRRFKPLQVESGKPDEDAKRQAQVVQLIEFVTKNPDILLFHDEYRDGHVKLPLDTHFEVWPCDSSSFKRWLSKSFYDSVGKVPSQNTLAGALQNIHAEAQFKGDEYKLGTRVVQRQNGRILYDLADKKWKAVRVQPSGWDIISDVPPYFRRYAYQAPQVEPMEGGDIRDVLRFVNIKRPDHQILFLVGLCSYFIPGFAHPVFYFYGPQGSAKTTASKILRKLIDPSVVEVLTLPRKIEELKQALSHYYFLSFDNVGYIPSDVSDLLCQAVTGSGFSKRKLYTDDEDVIRIVQANLSINSITIGSTRPDFLERSVLIELERVSKQDRKQEHEIMGDFERARPAILGAIFTVISKALAIKPTVSVATLPRMADFAIWGAAIAEAIGYSRAEFLDAYWRNINAQNEEVLSDDPAASLLIAFMESRDEWTGTASELLATLDGLAIDHHVNQKELPKSGAALSRHLRRLTSSLEEAGIRLAISAGTRRSITITNAPANAASAVIPSDSERQQSAFDDDIGEVWDTPSSDSSHKMSSNDGTDANDGIYGDSYTGEAVWPEE